MAPHPLPTFHLNAARKDRDTLIELSATLIEQSITLIYRQLLCLFLNSTH